MILACGIVFDICDEYYKLGESMAIELFKNFIIVIQVVFKTHYLHKPTSEDFERQLVINVERRWLEMFASLNHMHLGKLPCSLAKAIFGQGLS
jgi:hypothetical protein